MEALLQAPEGDEGLAGEVARGHLAVGLLVLAFGALAHEAAHQQVHAAAAVLAHARHASARAGVHLTVLT